MPSQDTMRALVTGAAGFVGSNLVDQLLTDGHSVLGVDSFTEYYDEPPKRRNLEAASANTRFELVEADLVEAPLEGLVSEVDVVFHLAGQPGVRPSWDAFPVYVERNIVATQRLLEACVGREIKRFVYSSSSSVYGNAERFPTSEEDLPAPVSPYGVTKLAAEHLCTLYGTTLGLPTVSLRYFTVFGPRQRPDMAMHRLIESAITGEPFPRYGDGSQIRDFTYVGDAVAANLLAAAVDDVANGSVFNIGGGAMTSLSSVIDTIEELVGRAVVIEPKGAAAGDAARTGADTSSARQVLGWRPEVSVRTGLECQVAWHLDQRER